jgi:hypothetical protein
MKSHRLAAISRNAITSLLLILASGYSGFAQTPAPPPTLAPPLISIAEARAIIDGAVAFTRDQNLNMAVVVVDAAGNLVSADKMDGSTINNTRAICAHAVRLLQAATAAASRDAGAAASTHVHTG